MQPESDFEEHRFANRNSQLPHGYFDSGVTKTELATWSVIAVLALAAVVAATVWVHYAV